MMIVKATEDTESGAMPDVRVAAAMARYNDELARAGVLLAADGLRSSAYGTRVEFTGTGTTVVDGPFPMTGDLVAGYWVLQVRSREEAVHWAGRWPAAARTYSRLELRPVLEGGHHADER